MINKYVCTGETHEKRRTELYNWLKTNAEGFVFDSVENGSETIECRKDGYLILSLLPQSSTNRMYELKLKNGTSMPGNLGAVPDNLYAIKTDSGIFINLVRYSGNAVYTFNVFVTKDGCLGGNGSAGSGPSYATFFTGMLGDQSFIDYGNSPTRIKSELTSFTPVCGNGNGSVSKMLFCTFNTSLSKDVCVIYDGENRYVYNGFLAMKE